MSTEAVIQDYLALTGYQPNQPISDPPSYGNVYISQYNPDSFSYFAYENAYSKLKRWIENSLDVFKTELREILFPLFLHSYLDLIAKGMIKEAKTFFNAHKNDHLAFHSLGLQQLDMINSATQIKENEFASLHRSERFLLPMSNTIFQLLISYLEENNFVALLRILNTYINIDVSSTKKKKKGTEPSRGLLGLSSNLETFNSQKIGLNLPPLDPKVREQIETVLKIEDEKQQDPSKKKLVNLFKQYRPDSTSELPPGKPVPMPPFKAKEIKETIEVIRDIAHRAPLSSTSLPSICFYTWHHTYDTLNCATFNSEVTLLAGGFSDSVIRVHSLTKEKLKALRPRTNLTSEELEKLTPNEIQVMRESEGTPYKKLIGHSGAVFNCVFSPDQRFLLSCSEDQTVRLWSMDTFTNLVCYRGHNFPIWDIDIGSEGVYFATASHDRTARLWSCDHIYPLRIFSGHLSDVDTVRFHPNSCYIATGSSDRTVRLWDVSRGNCVRVFNGGHGPVQTLAFSPDGKTLASGGDDKYIHLWDISSGTRIKKIAGHRGLVTSLSFSGEGTLLASSGVDGTVRVWDVLKSDEDDMVSTTDVHLMGAANLKKKRKKPNNHHLLETFPTKQTPVINLQFTRRNLLLATGPFCP